jgi:hypothetical protein
MNMLILKILLGVALLFLPPVINANNPETEEFAFDLDGDGVVQPLTDGLLVIRYLFGFEGDSLAKNAVGDGSERVSGQAVYDYAELHRQDFDIDLDGQLNPLTDGLLLIRYLFGFSNQSLTLGALGENATRTSANEVLAALDAKIDRDGDSFINSRDFFPDNAAEWLDTDLDGQGNNSDIDDDNDGVEDIVDAFPFNRFESLDSDLDGVGNREDRDDDNDGVSDDKDWAPLDASESQDSDGDGIGDNFDVDDDNDSIPDSLDLDPLDSNLSRSTKFNFTGSSSLGLSTELVEVTEQRDETFLKRSRKLEKFGLSSDNISNMISFDGNGDLSASPVSSSATLFVAEAQLSPDKEFLYLLTSAHIQRAIDGLDNEECSLYRVRLVDQTFACLLLTQDGDIEPSLLVPNYRSDFGRGAMDFRSDGAAVMQGFNWNRILPANVSGGTNSTMAWFMSPDGGLTPLRTDDYYYVTGVAWIDDTYFLSVEQPVSLNGGFVPNGRIVVWDAGTLKVVKIIENSEDNSGLPATQGMSKEAQKVHVAHLEIDPNSLTAKPSSRDSYVIVSSDRELALQLGTTSCSGIGSGQASKWFIDDIPFDGPDEGVWIELSDCETDVNSFKYDKQSGSGTDIKYRPLAFSGRYILHRKVMRSAYTLVSIDRQAYEWTDTYDRNVEVQLRENLGTISIRYQDPAPQGLEFSPSDELLETSRIAFGNGRDEGINLELVYEDANGAQVAETLYLRYFDLKDLENGQTRFLNAPLSAIEGFCLVDIEENRSKCSRLEGYDVKVEDNRGGGAPGVRTQAIIEDKIFVWFKDSSELVFYEASAKIGDFFERGDEALTISLSNIGGGDATAISQALRFEFDQYLEVAEVTVIRLQDSATSARIQLEFEGELSSVVDLPLVSLLGAASATKVAANEYAASERRSVLVLSFPTESMGEDSEFEVVFPKGFYLRDDNRRFRPDKRLSLTLCVFDYDCDGVVDEEDAFLEDPTESRDSDLDGLGDNADVFPNDASETTDFDSDGIGDNADDDDDNDGIDDLEDAFPLDATESADTDGDGVGNNSDSDDDGDGRADESDAFPFDAAESDDTDKDGLGNNADLDDDGDGVTDEEDAFPLDSGETHDTDGDGIGDNADEDSPVAITQSLIEFGLANTVVPENVGTARVTVSRLFSDEGDVSVSYKTEPSSALPGTNYESVSGTLSWSDGDKTPKQIEIPILDDSNQSEIEYLGFGLKLHSADNADLGKSETLVLILEDELGDLPEESLGVIQPVGYGLKVEEGEAIEIPFVRFGGSTGEVQVEFDYGFVGAFINQADNASAELVLPEPRLSWEDGQQDIQYLTVEIPGDAISEENQFLFIRGRYQAEVQGQLQEITTGTVLTVVDDDPTPKEGRIVPFDRVTRLIEGDERVIGFNRVGGAAGEQILNLIEVYTSPQLQMDDYTFSSTQLVWADGEGGSKEVVVSAKQNNVWEPTKFLVYDLRLQDGSQFADYPLRAYIFEDDRDSRDSDDDGVVDANDADKDDDGVLNWFDRFPLDKNEYIDSDNDGVGDNADAFPNNPDESEDSDGDGVGNNADTDDDNDGVDDANDAYPLDGTRSEDDSEDPTPELVPISQSLVELALGHVVVDESYSENLRIPVHRLFDDSSRVRVAYKTQPVTAVGGIDFAEAEGELVWEAGEKDTKFIELNIFDNADAGQTGFIYFRVQLTAVDSDNLIVGRDQMLVSIRDDERFDQPAKYPGKVEARAYDYRMTQGGEIELVFERFDGADGELSIDLHLVFDERSYLKKPATRNVNLSAERLSWVDGETGTKGVTFRAPKEEGDSFSGFGQYQVFWTLRRPDGVSLTSPYSVVVDVVSETVEEGGSFFLPTENFTRAVENELGVRFGYTRLGDVESSASLVINPVSNSAQDGDDFISEGAVSLDWRAGEAGTKYASVQLIDDEVNEPFEVVLAKVLEADPGLRIGVIFDNDASGDFDEDGFLDHSDLDDDNDGFADEVDRFPFNAGETRDTDGDGEGDNSDSDDDADGLADDEDNCPLIANADQKDFDGDGWGDLCDSDGKLSWAVDNISSLQLEIDNVDDVFQVIKVSSDQEQILQEFGSGTIDLLPYIDEGETLIRLRLRNSGSGWTFGWRLLVDGETVANERCGERNQTGCRNNENSIGVVYEATLGFYVNDTDQDGVVDSEDAFPNDDSESLDSDGDGIGDNSDQDADGNGKVDEAEGALLNRQFKLALLDESLINIRVASIYPNPDATDVTVAVERWGDLSAEVSVPFRTQEGAAKPGQDFTGVSGLLTWSAGDGSPKLVTIDLLRGFKHGMKEFYLELESGEGYLLGTHRASIGISRLAVRDADWGGFINFTSFGQVALEGSQSNLIELSRSSGSIGAVSVNYEVFNPDGEKIEGTIRWEDGDSALKAIILDLPDDDLPSQRFERSTLIKLSKLESEHGAVLGSRLPMTDSETSNTLTIFDDEGYTETLAAPFPYRNYVNVEQSAYDLRLLRFDSGRGEVSLKVNPAPLRDDTELTRIPDQFEVQWENGEIVQKTISLPAQSLRFRTQFSENAGFLLVREFEAINASLENLDSDGDGISDLDDWDFDNDGIPDYLDEDADGDGVINGEDEDPYNPDA